jgi:hypothetical protein
VPFLLNELPKAKTRSQNGQFVAVVVVVVVVVIVVAVSLFHLTLLLM